MKTKAKWDLVIEKTATWGALRQLIADRYKMSERADDLLLCKARSSNTRMTASACLRLFTEDYEDPPDDKVIAAERSIMNRGPFNVRDMDLIIVYDKTRVPSEEEQKARDIKNKAVNEKRKLQRNKRFIGFGASDRKRAAGPALKILTHDEWEIQEQ